MKLLILAAGLLLVLAGCRPSSAGDDVLPAADHPDTGADGGGASASDRPAEGPDEDSREATEEEILAFDAPFYAREFNVSIEEAKRRLVRQDEFGVLIDKVRLEEGDRVVDVRMFHEPEFGQWIYLSGDEPPTAATLEILRANPDLHVELGAK
jgi:hypothetical protein